jgi:hypothetical protein
VQIAQNLLNVIRLGPHYISKLDARYNVGWIILQNIYIKKKHSNVINVFLLKNNLNHLNINLMASY